MPIQKSKAEQAETARLVKKHGKKPKPPWKVPKKARPKAKKKVATKVKAKVKKKK